MYVFHIKMDFIFQKFFFSALFFFLNCEFPGHSKDERSGLQGTENPQAIFKISELYLWMFHRDLLFVEQYEKDVKSWSLNQEEQEMQPPPKI